MEFPDLGAQCSKSDCRQLDFLPIKCQQCQKLFCKDHFRFEDHGCPSATNFQIPACPLCGVPIPCDRNQPPDVFVENHILSNCTSQPAKSMKGKIFSNKCSVARCKTRETMKIVCGSCHKSFCLRHRLEVDHDCGKFSQLRFSQIKSSNSERNNEIDRKKRQEEEDYNLALAIQRSLNDHSQPVSAQAPSTTAARSGHISSDTPASPSKCLLM